MTKIAFIGCGAIADLHVEAYKGIPEAEITGVYDVSPNGKRFAEKYGFKIYNSMDELFNDASIDAVDICTPSGLHARLAISAMEAGKNVIVEKPVAITDDECVLLTDTCRKTGRQCGVISQMRFAPGIRAVKNAVSDGRLGKLIFGSVYMKYYRSPEYYSSSGWRGTAAMDGGGALMNQGIHGIDLLVYIMGPANSVSGNKKTLIHKIETEDTAAAILEFKSGALGVIEGTTSVKPGYPRRFEICGENGSIAIEEDVVVRCDVPGLSFPATVSSAGGHADPMAFSAAGHKAQLDNIISAFEGRGDMYYKIEEAVDTVSLIRAIYRSSETGSRIYL